MKALRCAALALAVVGLSAQGAETTNAWWEVDFTSPTPVAPEGEAWPQGYGGVNLPVDEGTLGALTNNFFQNGAQQPYLAGHWTMIDGDESYITNSFNATTNSGKAFGTNACIKLDTQGNDLTWTVETNELNNHIMEEGRKALVDADLYLVGSDSEPTEFDTGDVQTAIYLKNETDDGEGGTGETTNSVLCVYIFDPLLGNSGENTWRELDGVELKDNSWAHVQVIVDHSDDDNNPPTVQVFVNGTPMHARGGDATSWTAANGSDSQSAGRVSSVSFRGTGAVDNFVGQTVKKTVEKFDFVAEVFMDNTLVPQGQAGNVSRTELAVPVGPTEHADFLGFSFHDYEQDVKDATFVLKRIEFINQGNGEVTAIDYSYQNHQMLPTNSPAVFFEKEDITETDEETGDDIVVGERQTGTFNVLAPTAGATSNSVIARIYFQTFGANNAQAVTDLAGAVTTNDTVLLPATAGGTYPTNLVWTFDAVKGDNILTNLVVSNGAEYVDYANGKATVKVDLDAALDADTVFVTASYVAGALAEGQDLKPTVNGSTVTFAPYVPPVAIIVAGNVTNEYTTLQAAFDAVPTDGTETMVTLLADIDLGTTYASVLGTEGKKTVVLDLAGHVLEGSGYFTIGVAKGADLTVTNSIPATGKVSNTSATTTYGTVYVQEASFKATGVAIAFEAEGDYPAGNAIIIIGAGETVMVENETAITSTGSGIAIGKSTAPVTLAVSNSTVSVVGLGIVENGAGVANEITIFDSVITSSDYVAISKPGPGSLTISGEDTEITGYAGIVVRGGTLSIEDATVTSTGDEPFAVGDAKENGDYVMLAPAAIVYDTKSNYPGLSADPIAIASGTFVSPAGVNPLQLRAAEGDALQRFAVSGGSFSAIVPQAFCAEGFSPVTTPDENGRYTVVLGNAIWIGGASGDWNDPANWDIGSVPTKDTVVTFTNDTQVAICNTDACKGTVLSNAVVTLVRATGVEQPILRFYGDGNSAVSVASGATTGSLAVNGIALFNERKNETDLMIGCDFEVLGDVSFRGISIVSGSKSASFTITGKTTVSATARLRTIDFGTTKFQGGIEVAKGVTAKITTKPDGGATIGTGVTLVANDGTGDPTAIWLMQVSRKAVLLDGTSVSVDAAHAETFRVKKGSESDTGTYGGDCIVYKALRTYNITFKPENGTSDIVTNVFAGVTEYAPAAPTPAEGFTFVGWTNVLDATTVYTGNPMPAANADATYAAKYEAAVVTPPQVDAGTGLEDYVPPEGETVPEPFEFVEVDNTNKAQIAFVAPEAGTYVLYSCTTVDGQYEEDSGSAKLVTKGALVKLVETTPATTGAKFFKIYWTAP